MSAKGLDALDRAIEVSYDVNDKVSELKYRNMRLLTLIKHDRHGEAISLIHTELGISENVNDKAWHITLLTNLGNAHYDNNETIEATNSYKKALQLAQETNQGGAIVKLLSRLGAIHADISDIKTSNEFLIKAVDKAQLLNDRILLGQQYCLLAMNYKELDEDKKAVEYCQKAIDVYNEAKSSLHIKQAEELMKQIKP